MNKRVFGKKLSRNRKARQALFRSLLRNLVLNGKINTTYAKAKAIQADVDKVVVLAKKNTVSSQRMLLARFGNDRVVTQKLVTDVIKGLESRNSGFTRITKLPKRLGDNAAMARIEFSV